MAAWLANAESFCVFAIFASPTTAPPIALGLKTSSIFIAPGPPKILAKESDKSPTAVLASLISSICFSSLSLFAFSPFNAFLAAST